MTDNPADRRAAPRFTATFRIRLGFADLRSFVDGFAVNISKGGIFVPTRQPKDRGTEVRFELLLKDGSVAVGGTGRVAWTRPYDPNKPGERYGMGVTFVALDGGSDDVVRRALDWRAQHLPGEADREIADEDAPSTANAEPDAKPAPIATPLPDPKPLPTAKPLPTVQPAQPAKALPTAKPAQPAKALPTAKPAQPAKALPTAKPAQPAKPLPTVKPAQPAKALPTVKPEQPAKPLPTARPLPTVKPEQTAGAAAPAAPVQPPRPARAPAPATPEPPPMAVATPKPEADLPSLDDLEAALAEAEATAAPGMDATTEVLPPPEDARLEPPDEADGAHGGAANGGAAAPARRLSPRPPIGGAVPLTYEDALRQALAAEQAPDDAYEGVWVPKAAVAPDSHQEIIARLTQLEEPAESSVPDVQFAAEGGLGPGADGPREEPKVGFFGRLFGRRRK